MTGLSRLGRRAMTVAAVLTGVGLALIGSPGVAHADTVPYNDFASYGSIGFCDKNGNAVTHGNVNDKPFVWRAVSSATPPAPYAVGGGKATLVAYQPRPNTYPTQWSGDIMTAASKYSNPAHPMAAATVADFTLNDFIKEFPPMLDGLIQLRMFVGLPGKETLSTAYPTTDIKVTGDTWTVVRGASVPCSVSTAESSETAATIKSHVTPSPSARATGTHSAGASASPAKGTAAPTTSDQASADAAAASSAAQQADAGSNPTKTVVLAIFFGAMLLAAAGALWRLRRRSEP